MALSRLSKFQLVSFRNVLHNNWAVQRFPCANSVRTLVYTESGALLEKPHRVSFGLFKVLLVVGVSVFIGGTISKNGAEFLEKHDLFVPDEDD